MTYSDWKKPFKQLQNKPSKLEKYMKHNIPKKRTCDKRKRKCRRCGRIGAHLGMYGLHLCRQCFREIALKLGFKKFS